MLGSLIFQFDHVRGSIKSQDFESSQYATNFDKTKVNIAKTFNLRKFSRLQWAQENKIRVFGT